MYFAFCIWVVPFHDAGSLGRKCVVNYLDIDEVVKGIDVLSHKALHLQESRQELPLLLKSERK